MPDSNSSTKRLANTIILLKRFAGYLTRNSCNPWLNIVFTWCPPIKRTLFLSREAVHPVKNPNPKGNVLVEGINISFFIDQKCILTFLKHLQSSWDPPKMSPIQQSLTSASQTAKEIFSFANQHKIKKLAIMKRMLSFETLYHLIFYRFLLQIALGCFLFEQ